MSKCIVQYSSSEDDDREEPVVLTTQKRKREENISFFLSDSSLSSSDDEDVASTSAKKTKVDNLATTAAPSADKYCNVTTTRGSQLDFDFENLSDFECDDELLATLPPVVVPPTPQEPATVAAEPVAAQSPPSDVAAEQREQPTTSKAILATPDSEDCFAIFEKEAKATQIIESEKHKALKTPAYSNMTQNQYKQIAIHQKFQAQANELLNATKKSSYSSSSNSSKPARVPLGELISFEQALGRPAQPTPTQPTQPAQKMRQVWPKTYKKKEKVVLQEPELVATGPVLTPEYIDRLILNGVTREQVTAPNFGSLPGGPLPRFEPPTSRPANLPRDYTPLLPPGHTSGNNIVSEVQKRYKNLRNVADDQANKRVHAIFFQAAKMAANVYVQSNRVQYGMKLQESREIANISKTNSVANPPTFSTPSVILKKVINNGRMGTAQLTTAHIENVTGGIVNEDAPPKAPMPPAEQKK